MSRYRDLKLLAAGGIIGGLTYSCLQSSSAGLPAGVVKSHQGTGSQQSSSDLLTDQEGISLDVCSFQEKKHRCSPSLHLGLQHNMQTFVEYMRAEIPWVSPRNLSNHAESNGDAELLADLDVEKPTGVFLLPERALGFAYVHEMIHNSSGKAFYAPQVPCSSIRGGKLRDMLRAPNLAHSILGPSDLCNLWVAANLGTQDSALTPLHYDYSHNMYSQVAGRKRFWLLPPHFRGALAPFKSKSGIMTSGSRMQHHGWSDEAFVGGPRLLKLHGGARFTHIGGRKKGGPLLDNIFGATLKRSSTKPADDEFLQQHAIVVDLLPGDTLYIPPFWYHEVNTYGSDGRLNIAFNHWWMSSGTFDQLMKKLDGVVSYQRVGEIHWTWQSFIDPRFPPEPMERRCRGEQTTDAWPCHPASKSIQIPSSNLAASLRERCSKSASCLVHDHPHLWGETPTFAQGLKDAHPELVGAMQQQGLLADWGDHL
eukprot:TRINITY_DN96431_c0_g1_i1.p1 TRINITY_DN96431_c0_g1~~TRINITY_DN96431_c0_g1_i1.p1  ORF type:complete len:480 (-),score=67.76 TRINITY_DN96431_c0_g1_i1:29-1468(-)